MELQKNNLILLDWDDTLFPTSWVMEKHRNGVPITENIKKLDEILFMFLKFVCMYGKVLIITNAEKQWIKISLNLLDKTSFFIQQHIKNNSFEHGTITIISARDLLSGTFPEQIWVWKELTFKKILEKYFQMNQSLLNLICIGDALYEYNAFVSIWKTENFNRRIKYFKYVKFINKTSIDHLCEELTILTKQINKIIHSRKNLDLIYK